MPDMEWSSVADSGTSDADSAVGYGGVTAPGENSPAGAVHAWSALGGDLSLLDRVTCTFRPGVLPSRLPVPDLARASVAVCSLAAAELASVRASAPASAPAQPGVPDAQVPQVHVDDGAVATAFAGERHLTIDGRAPTNFAPLSRFWPTADGRLRTHANYPHHRARLLHALDITDTGDDSQLTGAVAAVLRNSSAAEAEELVYAAGGLAVAVRDRASWAQHPQGAAAATRPLLSADRIDTAAPLPLRPDDDPAAPRPGHGAAQGVRVLDLTRVIAGPVATRTLALLGADVLRLDSPRLPENPDAHADTGFGKRSATLDLASRSGQAAFDELLASADVVLTGYRPGGLDRFGLAPESLADRRPGLVVGQLSAWGAYGPWRRRRGFDSLVQAASGIAAHESGPDGEPGALPVQALDHATGYLLAAAVLRSLTEQRTGTSGSRVVRVALAQTASWLLDGLTPDQARDTGPAGNGAAGNGAAHAPEPWLTETDSPLGRLRHAVPPVTYDGGPSGWARPPGHPGTDPCAWP